MQLGQSDLRPNELFRDTLNKIAYNVFFAVILIASGFDSLQTASSERIDQTQHLLRVLRGCIEHQVKWVVGGYERSGIFHLDRWTPAFPRHPFCFNVTGAPYCEPALIERRISFRITGPTRVHASFAFSNFRDLLRSLNSEDEIPNDRYFPVHDYMLSTEISRGRFS